MHDHVSGVWAMHSDRKEVSRSAVILWCSTILSRPPACLLRSRCTVETFPCKMLRESLRSPVRDTGALGSMQSPVMVHGSTGVPLLLGGVLCQQRRSPPVRRCFMSAKGECPKQFTNHLPVHVMVWKAPRPRS